MRKVITFVLSTLVSFLTYGQNIQTITYETWSSGNWQNSAKQTHTYDSNDYMTNSLYELWDNPTNSYINNNQINYTNNSNGTVQQYISQTWNTTTNNWENSQRATYTYNSSDKPLTITYGTWSNGNWQNSAKQTHTYDGNDYITNSLYELWDNPTNSYINNNQINYTINSNGTVQQYISQTWNTTTNNWENSQRATYSYETLSLTDDYLINKISVYPNPTSDKLYFSEPINAILINSVGQILINEKHTSSLTLSDISIGVYILILSNDLGQVQQNKIVKK